MKDFPPCKTFYPLCYRWRNSGRWERVDEALQKAVRKRAGRKPAPTVGITDSQSVRTTEVGGPQRGDDGGKQVTAQGRT